MTHVTQCKIQKEEFIMKKALIVWGGWDGHTPKEAAELVSSELRAKKWSVRVEDNLAPLADIEGLKKLDIIIPIWTMGTLSAEQTKGLCAAVSNGVGLGGFHGGAGDAFRGNIEYEWMVGGIFVGHPHVGKYELELTEEKSPITRGLKKKFEYVSEQYYMLVDPGNRVLATTLYKHEGRKVRMPVVWTKTFGKGRVFYSALGHTASELKNNPDVLAMTIRGFSWAAASRAT